MSAPIDPQDLAYEEAALELENIITALEAPQVSLEDTLALYERGKALARRCEKLLEQAELRVRTLDGEEA